MATETTEDKIRIALKPGEDPRLKGKQEIFDLADLATIMLALTRDYREWLLEEYPDVGDKYRRPELRLTLYEINEGSIEFVLGVIGKAPLLFKLKKWTQNIIHNFRVLSNNQLPEKLPLDRAKTLRRITNNYFYGPYIEKIENDRYSRSDIGVVNKALEQYIYEMQYEAKHGVFMQFVRCVRIDGHDGANQNEQEYVVIDGIDENPFPLKLSPLFALFKTEVLREKGHNPFAEKYEVNVMVTRNREGSIIEYVLLDVLGVCE